ncbi:VOC family protein [Streptomyces sp. BRB081]|uniref:VOC family protein n=1 Tax=Streptomyces sp. BRB081 TaxID=2769544 RepID=UPI0018ACCA1A|nr:VOC family protein [Streptomyces sp. BRB081]MBL3807118.1 VOC family protein [Streptomyces sp. BRB081]
MKTWNVPSAPCWADLCTADPGTAARFYGSLLGWEVREVPGLDGYRAFLSEGEAVGGLGPRRPGRRPSVWRPYFLAESPAAGEPLADRVALARGRVLGEPVEVPGVCRATLCTDGSGAVFGLWEPHGHQGFGRVNAPGSAAWLDLATTDPDGARGFYSEVFGWQARRASHGAGLPYTEWSLGGRPFGGMTRITEAFPAGTAPRWLVHLSVPDCDAAAARGARLGAGVLLPPTTVEPGRFSVLTDPQGAMFAVIALSREARAEPRPAGGDRAAAMMG